MSSAVRLMLRRHRLLIASWTVLLIALSGGTVSPYQTTYPTPRERQAAVDMLRHDAATTLLYGDLPASGTPAQMFAWEIGAIVTLLAAVMAVLLAVALTRAAEEDGTWELLLACGTDRGGLLRGACTVLLAVASVLAGGCALAVGAASGGVDGVTWPGAVLFGAVIGVTFLVLGALTVLLAQLVPTARAARVLGFAAFGAAFAVRAFADTRDIGWLNWLSPLALRATAGPFTDDRWWPLAFSTGIAAALAGGAVRLSGRREYGAGLLPSHDTGGRRLNIRSGRRLVVRLTRGTILAWTVAVTCIGTLFAAMGSAAVEQSRKGDLGGFLGEQLGSGDPVAAYFSYCGTLVGLAVAAFAVLGVLRAGREEHEGLSDLMLAAGTARWRPLAWNTAVTAAGSAVILLTAGAAGALIAPLTITGTDVAVRAFAFCVGQWPAAAAAAGWTALLVGLRPRIAWLAWAPLAASGTLAFLGGLLGVPQSLRDLGIFQHVPDPVAPDPDLTGLAILLAVAVLTSAAGFSAAARRDITLLGCGYPNHRSARPGGEDGHAACTHRLPRPRPADDHGHGRPSRAPRDLRGGGRRAECEAGQAGQAGSGEKRQELVLPGSTPGSRGAAQAGGLPAGESPGSREARALQEPLLVSGHRVRAPGRRPDGLRGPPRAEGQGTRGRPPAQRRRPGLLGAQGSPPAPGMALGTRRLPGREGRETGRLEGTSSGRPQSSRGTSRRQGRRAPHHHRGTSPCMGEGAQRGHRGDRLSTPTEREAR